MRHVLLFPTASCFPIPHPPPPNNCSPGLQIAPSQKQIVRSNAGVAKRHNSAKLIIKRFIFLEKLLHFVVLLDVRARRNTFGRVDLAIKAPRPCVSVIPFEAVAG